MAHCVVVVSSDHGSLRMAEPLTGGERRIGRAGKALEEDEMTRVLAASLLQVVDVSRD